MNWPEVVNILFEVFCVIVTWFNVVKLMNDKSVKGVIWSAWIVYTMWSFWDVFYMYPTLNMHYAAFLAFLRGSGQTTWVFMAIYYLYFSKQCENSEESDEINKIETTLGDSC